MVFKLCLVVSAVLVLGCSAQRSANRLRLNRWNLFKYGYIKNLDHKRDANYSEPEDCTYTHAVDCQYDKRAAPTNSPENGERRAWRKRYLITLLSALTDPMSEAEILVPDQYSNQLDDK